MSDNILVSGGVAPGFEAVKDVFAKNLADGLEVGAGFTVYRDGEPVVDLWGGHADEAKTRPWQEDTIVNLFSSTKGPMALAVAMLVDRGKLAYSDKVATHWPEFAANGKQDITVAQLLSHQGGVCGLREPITVDKYEDWDFMCAQLAAMEPFWTPGDGSGYHAVTYGFLAGELVRRIDGRTPGRFIAEEISTPLNADFHVGLPDSVDARIAPLIAPKNTLPLAGKAPPDYVIAALANPPMKPEDANKPGWRRAEIPAANGHGTAKALARIYAPLSLGGGNIIGTEALDAATAEQCLGEDRNLGFEMSWGCGFIRNNTGIYGPNTETFGHSGWGGSLGFADRKEKLAVGYVMNQMDVNLQGDPRSMGLIGALYQSL
ncbi:MAG: serine hydrolase domain-containing protein [Alphaproteobacteria bacterium]